MLRVREYENNVATEENVTDTLTGILVDSAVDIDNIVFSVIVNRDSLKEYLKIFEKSTIALHTFKDDYFEVTSDFLLNKRMCNRFVHRLLFTHKDIINSPSSYSSIILGKSLDDLIANITGYDEKLVGKIKQHLETIYKDKLKIYNLQNITRDIINIVKGIELCNEISFVKVEVESDPLFDIVDGFDVSLHAFLIMVVNGLDSKDNNFFSKLYQTIKSYFSSCDIKDININKDNYRQIIHSICNSSSLIEKYRSRNQKTRIKLMCIVTEILFICLEIFEQNKTNGIGNEYKNIHIDIINDMKDNDILKVFLPFLNINRELFFIRQTLETIESKEENVERNWKEKIY